MIIGLLAIAGILAGSAPLAEAVSPKSEILDVLDRSAAAWNQGNVDGFMEGYAADPETLFVGPKGVLRGFEQVRDKYHRTYEKDPRGMGTLSFTNVEIRPLGPDHALAIGKWNLVRGTGQEPASGYFTLTFERRPAGWRIICDHTD